MIQRHRTLSSFSLLPPLKPEYLSVKFGDKTFQVPKQSTVSHIIETGLPTAPEHPPAVGAYVNGDILGLGETVDVNVETFSPIYLNTPRGADIYRRTLTFLCGMAVSELFCDRHFSIGHSLGNAYYFQLGSETEPVTEEDLKKISDEMHKLVKLRLPIDLCMFSWHDVIRYLETAKIPEALSLIRSRNTPLVRIVKCEQFFHPAQGAYLDNTSWITKFELMKYGDPNGFLIRFPHTATPDVLGPFEDEPKLFAAFQYTQAWEKKIKVGCIGDVNTIVRSPTPRPLKDFVVFCEAVHDRMLVEIATQATQNPETKIILIAGPSSSGKTTFARKLCVHLRVLGKTPVCISLDEFYRNRVDCPKDPVTGQYDFEDLNALNLPLINTTFEKLVKGEKVEMPTFDFKDGISHEHTGHFLQLEGDSMIVVEGIHGLNDELTKLINPEQKFKVFISALTRLHLDEHHRVSTTDNRLLRRMVRDYQFRGTGAAETIQRWASVRAGEVKHIFPHQNSANVIFNSSVEYEINALKTIAEPLLKNIVPSQTDVYPEAQRLLKLLENFDQMSPEFIPNTAIVREFLGGSAYHDE